MEDQSADSSDLTAADAASVPQGKAARNRHRLPRQKAHQVEQSDEAATGGATPDDGPEPVEAADESTPAETIVEPSPDPGPEVETTEVTAPTKGRRRLPWKRDKVIGDV
ncbi:MAG: Mce-associated rane protein, partial [Mycobacterium sp.]|nr:Mce-associated rane protein [Mycobacterium sp.]